MAKKSPTGVVMDPILIQVRRHYDSWTISNQTRRQRPNGWDAVTDAYYGKLPSDWPYSSRVVDPRIRTSLIEKKARLLNQKLRGRLVPRQGSGDASVIKSRIHNAILDFQWDNANDGGTMLSKWGSMDQDTRMYASRLGLVKWRHAEENGEVVFDGNEFYPLDVRDSGLDPTCTHIRDAKWFQHREWAKVEDMEQVNDLPNGKQIYPGLAQLKGRLALTNDRRDTAYANRILQLKGLQDQVGMDRSFPVVEVVTEYRRDRWITFAPKYNVILRDIPNPYKHGKIPVVQLRYYKVTGDAWGESEVEPVLPMWKAIQAILCGYLDNMNIHNRPPLKILDGKVRIETIVFGPEAQWLIDQPNAVEEFQGSNSAMEYFQVAYQAAISAFNTAMGDLSQGTSQLNPIAGKGQATTATEIDQTTRQQNTRDQDNQTQLAEALEDMMSMWLANNQQFIFADPDKQDYVMKIVGADLYSYFQRVGMDQLELTPEATQTIGDIIHQQDGNVSDTQMQSLIQAGMTPKYPVFENPKEKNPAKLKYKPKMVMDDNNDSADLTIIPEDLDGIYDYIPDVQSMAAGANQMMQDARNNAINRLTNNPTILQQLAQEGTTVQFKDLLIADFEGAGLPDAEKYFQSAQQNTAGQAGQGNPLAQALPIGGLPPGANPGTGGGQQGSMGQPAGAGLPNQIQPSVQQGAGF